MKTQAIHSEDLTISIQEGQENQKTGVSQNSKTQTGENASATEMPANPIPEFETGPDGSVRIPLDMIFIDGSVFSRASLDRYTVEQYAAALIRGEKFSPISVEPTKQGDYMILKGVHRFEAYSLRKDIYTGKIRGDFYDEPLPLISDTELNTIPCFIETIPPDIDPIIFAMQDNLKHGKPLTPEDYKKIAREVYKDNLGASIQELAKLVKISRKVFKSYVADLVKASEKEKEALILELHNQGNVQTEISQKLTDKFPKAKGFSQSQISEFLLKTNHATETSHEGANNASAVGEGVPEDSRAEEDHAGDGVEVEEETAPPEASAKPLELQIVCGNLSDTIMILGLTSLAPHLQEKVKTEVEKLVNQIREENRAAHEHGEDPEQASPKHQGETPDKP